MLMSCKKHAGTILKFLRITDEGGLLSLTNITMMVVIVKVIITPAVSMQDLTALCIGVIGYQAKRGMSK